MKWFTRRLHPLVLSVAIAGLGVGCSNTDAAITAQIKNKLATDEALKAQKIEVTTDRTVVTLSGTVESASAKSRALTVARETSGVTDVLDKLDVRSASSAAAVNAPGTPTATDSAGTTSSMPGMGVGMGMHGEMGMPPEGMMREMARMGAGGMPASPSGGTPAPAPVVPLSALPGTPGVSHLYHIGSTGFFLDQSSITLTADQRAKLEGIKERALSARGDAQKRIQTAEQELWTLTGEGADEAAIEAKIGEIERIRTNQRLEFIRAVGEASQVLTREQQSRLLGTSASSK